MWSHLRLREGIEHDVDGERVYREGVQLTRGAAHRFGHRRRAERQKAYVLSEPVALHETTAQAEAAALWCRTWVLLIGIATVLRRHRAFARDRLESAARDGRQFLPRLARVVEELVDLSKCADRLPVLVRLPAAENIYDVLQVGDVGLVGGTEPVGIVGGGVRHLG